MKEKILLNLLERVEVDGTLLNGNFTMHFEIDADFSISAEYKDCSFSISTYENSKAVETFVFCRSTDFVVALLATLCERRSTVETILDAAKEVSND